jgi:hypothetical protein
MFAQCIKINNNRWFWLREDSLVHVHNRKSLLWHGFTTQIGCLTHNFSTSKWFTDRYFRSKAAMWLRPFSIIIKCIKRVLLLEIRHTGTSFNGVILKWKSHACVPTWGQVGLNSSQLMQSKLNPFCLIYANQDQSFEYHDSGRTWPNSIYPTPLFSRLTRDQ